MKKEIETINELTQDLVDVKNDLKNGHIELERAREINNTAGKILNTIKVQMQYTIISLACEAQGHKMVHIPYLGEQKCLSK